MAAFPTYSTGTVAVANGATAVIGTGTNWSGVNAKPGDDIVIDGRTVVVMDVTDATHLAIDAWPFTTVSAGAAYKVVKRSPLRYAGGDAMASVSDLVAALNTDGFYVFVDPDDSVPDPSYGEDNQFAFQPTTFKLWLKTGGVWVLQPSLSVGVRQAYSTTTTDADPGAGIFRLNNSTPASATAAYLDNVDSNGATVSGIWDLFDDSTSTIKGVIRFQKASDPTVWAQFNVTGSVVDGTGYRKLTLASGVASGSFTNADAFVIAFYRAGDIGSTGPSPGIRQAYSTTTTDSDPGAGIFRLNNSTPASATAAYLDNVDAGGVTVSGIWDLFDDATSTTRGFIRFQKASDPTVWAQYRVTGSVVDGTGYRKLTLASGVASGSFTNADVFAITFFRSGDSASGDMLAANNLSDVASATTSRANLGILYVPQGRLTLETGVALSTSNQTAKTTIYYTPYLGNQIPLYDGSKMIPTAFTEISVATTDTAKNPAAIGASKVNDWFVWNDSGTLRLSHGPDWTNDTTRSAGTALVNVNGIWLNNASITNGPAASRGTYVGTTRSNASSQLDFSRGGSGSGGVAALLNVWNMYNRLPVTALVEDTFSSSSISVGIAALNASNNNRVNYVQGLAEGAIDATFVGTVTAGSGGNAGIGIGHDSTSAVTGLSSTTSSSTIATATSATASANGLGAHFLQALQLASTATGTVYGTGAVSIIHSGLRVTGQF